MEKTTLMIAEGTTRISNEAFKGYKGIEAIAIPNSVVIIGSRAFAFCS